MMRLLYSLIWYLALPVLLLRLWWRGRLAPAYRRRWAERLALGYPQPAGECVWIHVVSVGEALAAAPLIRALLARHPGTRLLVTTTTPTGSDRVRDLFGDQVVHVYCPWDLPGALSRFFRAFRPRLILVMETELWPNLVAQAARRQVPVVLVNGRLSEKSFRGYARFSALVRPMMASLSALLVQTDAEAQRFVSLGANASVVQVTGSIKFDLEIEAGLRQQAQGLREQCGQRPVWIAASTHAGEDEIVIDAHRQIMRDFPDALLLLVPRHPERFDRVAQLVVQSGLGLARRSQGQSPAGCQVYLCDTMGELLMLFGVADVALVAGSMLPPLGGHNLLEPAAWETPVISGPFVHNFKAIAEWLDEAGGLVQVAGANELASQVMALLGDGDARRARGRAAAAVVARHRGALGRVVQGVEEFWPASAD